MKKLDLSSVSATNEFPVKEGTFDFLQLAYQECLNGIANNLVAGVNPTVPYVLFGCKNTGTGLNYIISAGAIFYAGEIYMVPAATFTAPGGQVAIGNVVVSQYIINADPVAFTDGNSRNVHNITQIVFSAGVSLSGQMDFTDLKQTPLILVNGQVASMPASVVVKFDQDYATFFAAAPVNVTITFDFTNAIVGNVTRLKWAFGSGRTLTVTGSGSSTIVQESGDLTQVADATNVMYFIYLGKNEITKDEVGFNIKQTL